MPTSSRKNKKKIVPKRRQTNNEKEDEDCPPQATKIKMTQNDIISLTKEARDYNKLRSMVLEGNKESYSYQLPHQKKHHVLIRDPYPYFIV